MAIARIIIPTTLVLIFALSSFVVHGSKSDDGKKWAVLVAGSKGYVNYRHQSDVCHAYQVLKKGGVKEENIVVFMYDDIAFNQENPRPGVIINRPNGVDVYEGVPKDYTGKNATIANLFGVLLGNKSALTGGSGKVVDSGPKDHIFIYYSDHGGAGVLEMPNDEMLYAKDLIEVFKKKHAANGYQRMVIYVEACESGSNFEGLLPENLNIYATTASNPTEPSFATYCSEEYPDVPDEYTICLADLYSASWIEDSELQNLRKENLQHQYQAVRRRTGFAGREGYHSHVMQYGTRNISNDLVFSYIGTNPENDNITLGENVSKLMSSSTDRGRAVSQHDANLHHLFSKFRKAPEGSDKKLEARQQLNDEISLRKHVDMSMIQIAKLLFGSENGPSVLETVRPRGQPLVDDWDCLKLLVKIYEKQCGSLSRYGMKYMRGIANMCNAKISSDQMALASAQICSRV